MISYSLTEIAGIVSGNIIRYSPDADLTVSRIAVDSRTLYNRADTLFFALRGIRNDGHQFISGLSKRGVRAFVVTCGVTFSPPEEGFVIETADSLEALQLLAAWHRKRFSYPVVAITGSNGKTVVKEWLHDLLTSHYSIVRSPKSYNSQTGVPLSVWYMQEENNLAIFEAGISLTGEMEKLQRIITPTIGIFTNIGDAHQENFSSLEEKTGEKLKLFTHVQKLIFSLDQGSCSDQISRFCQSRAITPISWSAEGRPAFLSFSVSAGEGNTAIKAFWKDQAVQFSIPFTDVSSVENCCHCFALLVALDSDPQRFVPGFTRLEPVSMRLELKRGINQCLLLNDYYNSDINSLEVALSVLHRQAENNHLRKIVILSDIRQSGYSEPDLYRQVNRLLSEAGVQLVIGIGEAIKRSHSFFSTEKQFFSTTAEFVAGFRSAGWSHSAVLIKGARDFRFEEISAMLQQKAHQSVLEIDLDALRDNLNYYRSLLNPETKIMVMVKAFSYGSGDVEIARFLQYSLVDYLAVAVTDEGVELRNAGITLPVIVMNPEYHSFQQIIDYRLEPNLYSPELVRHFGMVAGHNALRHYPVHLKIDTGMNRLGLKGDEEIEVVTSYFRRNPQLRLNSVFSHLAASEDLELDEFTLRQISRFREVSDLLRRSLGYQVDRHILNSAGIERFPLHQMEMVRLGIGLYGVSSAGHSLRPAGRFRSTISQIKEVLPGETIGYGRSGIIKRPSRVAIIPAGYADGVDRRLGNGRGSVCINETIVPLVGNICMDMCMADVTGVSCETGDEAEFFGIHIPISEVAAAAGTIPYEILTGISQRIKRVYIQE